MIRSVILVLNAEYRWHSPIGRLLQPSNSYTEVPESLESWFWGPLTQESLSSYSKFIQKSSTDQERSNRDQWAAQRPRSGSYLAR